MASSSVSLVPMKQVLVISILFAMVVTSAYYTTLDDPEPPSVNNTTENRGNLTNQTTQTDSLADSPNFDVEYIRAEDAAIGGNVFQWFLDFSMVAILSLVMLVAGFLFLLNSNSLKNYLNHAFELADLSQPVGFVGRTWDLGNGIIARMNRDIRNKEFEIIFPRAPGQDPREFGFLDSGNFVKTKSSIQQITMKLQVVRLYLEY